jgi:CRP-like cAMP-binding protein
MEVSDLLKQAPLFAELSKADLDLLSPSVRVETYKPGQVIVREGRVGAAFFLLISGSVEAVKGLGTPDETVLKKLAAGDFFGEITTMKHGTRSASVRAVEGTKCVVIQRLHFDSYVEQFPSVRAKIEAALAARPDYR